MKKFQSDSGEAYFDRNQAFLALAKLAQDKGWECGIALDPKETEWPFVYIELPTGQVTSHFPKNELKNVNWLPRFENNSMWDGHDLEMKRQRMETFIAS
jgi:hypothetical protein